MQRTAGGGLSVEGVAKAPVAAEPEGLGSRIKDFVFIKHLKELWPTKRRYQKWSLPSKLTFIGAYIGGISLLVTILQINFCISVGLLGSHEQEKESY